MARPTSTAKLGFFPLPPPVGDLIVGHLKRKGTPEATYLLDPCAGRGAAIQQIAAGLGVPEENIHGVELSESRSEAFATAMPNATLLGPATFLGIQSTYNSFSLAYVNPPFDHEIGGGRREELSFFVRALNYVAHKGVVVLVIPQSTLLESDRGAEAMRISVECRLADVEVYKFPDEHRHFNEIVVFGTKRLHPVPPGQGRLTTGAWWQMRYNLPTLGSQDRVWSVPEGARPRRFLKCDFAPRELREALARSPVNEAWKPPRPDAAPSPPLPLAKGHVALLLASGRLDGLVFPEGEPPHVVRGTARKVTYLDTAKCEERENDDGSVTTKKVYSEKIELIVRAVSTDGKIRTFTDEPSPDQAPTEENEE